MKVNVLGLLFAAQRLESAAEKLQALKPPELAPLAQDATSVGAAGRLDTAATALWASVTAQAASLHTAAFHLKMIAAKFGTQEELNKASLVALNVQMSGVDAGTLSALEPVPPLPPDLRVPMPPVPPLSGEQFSQQIHGGSATRATDFSTAATTDGATLDSVASTVREVAAAVPELWDSPVGTEALSGRLTSYVTNLTSVSDRYFQLGEQARRHADDYSETSSATPTPQDFQDAKDAYDRARAAKDAVGMSQAVTQQGLLDNRARAEAARYAGITETTTAAAGAATPQLPGTGGGGSAGAGVPAPDVDVAGVPASDGPANGRLAKAGATQTGQAGEGAGQFAEMLPSALGAIGGLAGGAAGMAGQVPQALMQSGQGLAQAATQGMSGLSTKPTDGERSTSVGGLGRDETSAAKGGAGGGGGGGATHPAGSLGPPVTPSTSHTPAAMPSGSAPPPTTPATSGSTATGGMGMPMGGMIPHGQGGAGEVAKVAADKKVVTPAQPHTEAVTGRVADRTAAAAEAAKARTDSDGADDSPPRGPVLRRITLAPLDSDRS